MDIHEFGVMNAIFFTAVGIYLLYRLYKKLNVGEYSNRKKIEFEMRSFESTIRQHYNRVLKSVKSDSSINTNHRYLALITTYIAICGDSNVSVNTDAAKVDIFPTVSLSDSESLNYLVMACTLKCNKKYMNMLQIQFISLVSLSINRLYYDVERNVVKPKENLSTGFSSSIWYNYLEAEAKEKLDFIINQ